MLAGWVFGISILVSLVVGYAIDYSFLVRTAHATKRRAVLVSLLIGIGASVMLGAFWLMSIPAIYGPGSAEYPSAFPFWIRPEGQAIRFVIAIFLVALIKMKFVCSAFHLQIDTKSKMSLVFSSALQIFGTSGLFVVWGMVIWI